MSVQLCKSSTDVMRNRLQVCGFDIIRTWRVVIIIAKLLIGSLRGTVQIEPWTVGRYSLEHNTLCALIYPHQNRGPLAAMFK